MAAKKKKSAKKRAPKKAGKKTKTTKKRIAPKATTKKKAVPKRKAVRKKKPLKKIKNASKKSAPKKAVPRRKKTATAKKTSSSVKAKEKEIITTPSTRGIIDTVQVTGIDIDVLFTLGVGHLTATLIRKGTIIQSKELSQTGNIKFDNVVSGDIISLNGSCAGKARIETNRNTSPATPLEFNDETILSSLDIL